jgi:hypothetical protein
MSFEGDEACLKWVGNKPDDTVNMFATVRKVGRRGGGSTYRGGVNILKQNQWAREVKTTEGRKGKTAAMYVCIHLKESTSSRTMRDLCF